MSVMVRSVHNNIVPHTLPPRAVCLDASALYHCFVEGSSVLCCRMCRAHACVARTHGPVSAEVGVEQRFCLDFWHRGRACARGGGGVRTPGSTDCEAPSASMAPPPPPPPRAPHRKSALPLPPHSIRLPGLPFPFHFPRDGATWIPMGCRASSGLAQSPWDVGFSTSGQGGGQWRPPQTGVGGGSSQRAVSTPPPEGMHWRVGRYSPPGRPPNAQPLPPPAPSTSFNGICN